MITVVRSLGEGANGCVYLVRIPDKPSHCALKLGNDSFALQSEMNALEAAGGGDTALLFSDDAVIGGITVPFYVMNFIPGISLGKLIAESNSAPLSREQISLIGESLLMRLQALHGKGWAFGDLKPDNVVIGDNGHAQLVDFGGATVFGESVKQMTELYDRGFWKAGTRRSEATYDLFAFAVIIMECGGLGAKLRSAAASPKRKLSALQELVHESKTLISAAFVLKRLLCSEYASVDEVLRDWKAAMKPQRFTFAKQALPLLWFAGACVSFAFVLWRTTS